nr:hypothetical protein GCM10020185_25430 [Pseudomonas brassicacearum subsp. brassicacearum]
MNRQKVSYEQLLKMFWELHNPTQGMRQGNDIGTQYRSVIYATNPAQLAAAKHSEQVFQAELTKAGKGTITTEIEEAPTFLLRRGLPPAVPGEKNPEGYCGIGGTGVTCPI